MDTVTFAGKEYTKAAIVAKRFKYTTDYIGQLCRAEKVDSRLVGRAWYVHVDSLLEHRKGRYKGEVNSSEKKTEKVSNNYLSRVDVEPIVNRKIVKILRSTDGRVSELPVRYESDEYSLIPKVEKSAVSKRIPVNPAESEQLKVTSGHNQVSNFKTDPMPEVYLKGNLTVTEAPDMEETLSSAEALVPLKVSVSESPEKLEKQSHVGNEKASRNVRVRRRSEVRVDTNVELVAKVPIRKNQDSSKSLEKKPDIKPIVDISSKTPKRSIPSKTVDLHQHQKKTIHQPVTSESSRGGSHVSIVATFFASLILAALLVATETEVLADELNFTTRLFIQTANLTVLFGV